MNENAIVEELYDAIENHGLMNTICAVFGKGAQIELGYTQKLCDTNVAIGGRRDFYIDLYN